MAGVKEAELEISGACPTSGVPQIYEAYCLCAFSRRKPPRGPKTKEIWAPCGQLLHHAGRGVHASQLASEQASQPGEGGRKCAVRRERCKTSPHLAAARGYESGHSFL